MLQWHGMNNSVSMVPESYTSGGMGGLIGTIPHENPAQIDLADDRKTAHRRQSGSDYDS